MSLYSRTRPSVLETDLYQLTMAAAYHSAGKNPESTFELFVRRLPRDRGYLITAGLSDILDYLDNLSFSEEEVRYLRTLPVFQHTPPDFFERLQNLRFTGKVRAVPEGTVVFPGEPLIQVTAPLLESQLVETWLLSMFNFSTMIATKAARIVQAAQGRGVLEFGTRRAHGPGAGILAARNAYISGFAATSNVEAGLRYGIPVAGTCAHSFIMSFPSEATAFEKYKEVFPDYSVLLVDTYDTIEGVKLAARQSGALQGIRIDSGDLSELAKKARVILDEEGRTETKIVVSSDLNEHKIQALLKSNAPIDLFGVGTELATVKDAPALSGVYKLVEQTLEGKPRYVAKNSPSKPSYPGRKQIARLFNSDGLLDRDLVLLEEESLPAGAQPLLEVWMEGGRLLKDRESLDTIRQRVQTGLSQLPESMRRLKDPETLKVEYSQGIQEARLEALEELTDTKTGD